MSEIKFKLFKDLKLLVNTSWLSIFLLTISISSWAYEPCEFRTIGEKICFENLSPTIDDKLTVNIKSVLITKDKENYNKKDTIVIVPGGPGGDSQGIGLSLNGPGLLDAFWHNFDLNVVLFDPRGTGGSKLELSAEFYKPSVFSTKNNILDLVRVIKQTSPDKPVILFAHSAGGNIAAKVAANYPELVKGLIMYSASVDIREVGESNLRLFSESFQYWHNFINTKLGASEAKIINNRRLEVEIFLKNVIKLQRIEGNRPAELRNFYLKNFRTEIIKAIENYELEPIRLDTVLNSWEKKISSLDKVFIDQVNSQNNITFDSSTYEQETIKRGVWIKTAVICTEGLLEEEVIQPMWLEGISLQQGICQSLDPILKVVPNRNWLDNIKVKSLFIGGTEDFSQLPSAVTRNAGLVKNSQLEIITGAGHEVHKSHTMDIFNLIEKYIKGL